MIDLQVDELQLYFGDDYVINDKIILHQPTINEVVLQGEAAYYSMIHTLTAIPSDTKSQLWDLGIDWCKISDFELFMMMTQTLTQDKTGIIFGDLDFSKLRPYNHPQIEGEIILADKEAGIIIDNLIYMRIVNYLRKLHNITPKPEKAKGKRAKQAMIDEDRRRIEFNKDKPFRSYLLPLISSVKVKQGYTKEYVRNMGLYEFFDDIARLQIINNADHLLSAAYAGTIDMKKINKEELNWMKEL